MEQKLKQGTKRFVVLNSSPGGNVSAGVSAYNFLKGTPAEVITWNFGDAHSVAVILFCAGSRRLSVPHTRFLLHGLGFDVTVPTRFDEHTLDERMKGLRLDRETIAGIIADSTEPKKKVKDVDKDILSNTVLNSQQAVDYGLVREIKTELFPKGAEIISITD